MVEEEEGEVQGYLSRGGKLNHTKLTIFWRYKYLKLSFLNFGIAHWCCSLGLWAKTVCSIRVNLAMLVSKFPRKLALACYIPRLANVSEIMLCVRLVLRFVVHLTRTTALKSYFYKCLGICVTLYQSFLVPFQSFSGWGVPTCRRTVLPYCVFLIPHANQEFSQIKTVTWGVYFYGLQPFCFSPNVLNRGAPVMVNVGKD